MNCDAAGTKIPFAGLNELVPCPIRPHCRRVANYAALTAEALKACGYYKAEITDDFINCIGDAAFLYDIGMSQLPDHLLDKPVLTDNEDIVYKKHTVKGGTIIIEAENACRNGLLSKLAFEIALFHHENYNGTGYPFALTGRSIPLGARIVAFARTFDILMTNVQKTNIMSFHHVVKKLDAYSGNYFDPAVINSFISQSHRYKLKARELQQVIAIPQKVCAN